jgi:ADP-ribosylglycohydrolase
LVNRFTDILRAMAARRTPRPSTSSDAHVLERTYAGVLGKMTGVYLGRPVEGWSAERIEATHGTLDRYVPDLPIVVSDDDLSGAFTFVRALEDAGYPDVLSEQHVAAAWLDHLVEGRTTLWWGGLGSSTEHTAYLRLRAGIEAPRSGSAAINGRRAAEQIGARIFADAWGLVHPGDPRRAADDARVAARVSHDGLAIDAAAMLAATVAAAFVGDGVGSAVRRGLAELPVNSPLMDLWREVQTELHLAGDWRAAWRVLSARHPYARYGGHCPLVPNEAAMQLALAAAPDDIGRALEIAVGCGLDTDCNAGNVGCVLGVALGPEAFASPRARALREPMNDRLFVVAAEGGNAVTDALTVARRLHAYATRRRDTPEADGLPRFDFAVRGARQGFRTGPGAVATTPGGAGLEVAFVEPPGDEGWWRAWTPTDVQPEERVLGGYPLVASPTLYPGQEIVAEVEGADVRARLVVEVDPEDGPAITYRGPAVDLAADARTLVWRVPTTVGPVARVGIEACAAESERPSGLRLRSLSWSGGPSLDLRGDELVRWRRAWVDAFDHVHVAPTGGLDLAQDGVGGWMSIGGRAWRDLRVEATLEPPFGGTAGVFLRGRGARRRLALSVGAGAWWLDEHAGAPAPLARGVLELGDGEPVTLALMVANGRVQAWIDGVSVAHVTPLERTAPSGAAGVLGDHGTTTLRSFAVAIPTGADP